MNVSTFPPPSLSAQFAELKREKAMRARVYPHWISTGKIKKQTADYQMAALEAAMATLEGLALGKPAPDPLREELVATLKTAARRLEEFGAPRDWIDETLAKVTP